VLPHSTGYLWVSWLGGRGCEHRSEVGIWELGLQKPQMVPLDSAMDAPHRDTAASAELEVAHTQTGHKISEVPADQKVVAPKHFHSQPLFLGHPRT